MFKSKVKLSVVFLVSVICFLLVDCSSREKMIEVGGEKLKKKLIYQEDFDGDLSQWQVEQMPGGSVEVKNSKLEINDVGGCTVWLKEKFTGSILIEYDVFLIQNGGLNDRVSDLNCFWMASDPKHKDNLFVDSKSRGGKFTNYNGLQLYYMGVGGNDNRTTRFRRYVGNGERPLLPEHDLSDSKFMLEPNKAYHIKLIAHHGTIQYYRDNVLLAELKDSNPYTSGHFGFRTVKNHMTADNFKVYSLN